MHQGFVPEGASPAASFPKEPAGGLRVLRLTLTLQQQLVEQAPKKPPAVSLRSAPRFAPHRSWYSGGETGWGSARRCPLPPS